MAVANFQYITRMSSGFKVYILEGKLEFFYSLMLLYESEYLYYVYAVVMLYNFSV